MERFKRNYYDNFLLFSMLTLVLYDLSSYISNSDNAEQEFFF